MDRPTFRKGRCTRNSPNHPADSARVNEALAIVQKGLESIQSLQQQTAQAHQKFLETQTQASRTLQEMMKSTQMVVGATLGKPIPSVTDIQTPIVHPEPVSLQPTGMDSPSAAAAMATPPVVPVAAPQPTDRADSPAIRQSQQAVPENAQPAIPGNTISKTLIDIVAQLTGYPDDMLGLDMDIEADLGIDSIKRVEILSAMEERMPHLPQVTPDMVGTLKTLGQICDFLSTDAPSATVPAPPIAATEAPAADGSASVQQTLIDIVAQLTGYPDDMLGLDMDIEADLGIDSIKRVEILSAMEERMPHLPQVTPDMVGHAEDPGTDLRFSFHRCAFCHCSSAPNSRDGGTGSRRFSIGSTNIDSHRRRAHRLSGRHAGTGHGHRGGFRHRFHQAGRDSFRHGRTHAPPAPGHPGHGRHVEDPGTDLRVYSRRR